LLADYISYRRVGIEEYSVHSGTRREMK